MSNLIPFDFNGFTLEVIEKNGDPWFIASPLAEFLGYQNPARDVRTHVDEEDIQNMYIPIKSNNYTIVNESGLYSLVIRSNKPEAKRFKRWVTHEVLPSIRKTGSYSHTQQFQIPKTLPEALRLAASLAEERDEAIRTKAEIGSRREATAMNTASQAVKQVSRLKAELDQSMEYCSIKRMEMLHHGQKFKWQLLKSTGIEMGIPPVDVFDANYGTVKAYHADVWLEAYAINLSAVAGNAT